MENRLVLFGIFLLWILGVALLNLAFMMSAQASPHNHDINITLPDININLESQPQTNGTPEPLADTETPSPVSDAELSRVVALSGAASHQFDWATNRFQASANAAFYDSQQAISFGMAKRFESIDALWHTSVSIADGGSSELVTFGATWRW